MQEVSFDQLPEKLKERVNGVCNVAISQGDPRPEIILCRFRAIGAECIIQDGSVFGIFDYSPGTENVSCNWIGSNDIELLYKHSRRKRRK